MQETIRNTFKSVRQASRELVMIGEQAINSILIDLAETIPDCSSSILEANRRDLDRMDPADPMFDRLLLNEKRLEIIAADIRNVATLPSPLDIVLEQRRLLNGLELKNYRTDRSNRNYLRSAAECNLRRICTLSEVRQCNRSQRRQRCT